VVFDRLVAEVENVIESVRTKSKLIKQKLSEVVASSDKIDANQVKVV
jgi:hypothetical protein